MSLTVRFRSLARVEFDEAIDWYRQNARTGVSDQFQAAVDETVKQAADNPSRFPVAHRDTREAVVDGFPYCVYYRVRAGLLAVIAVYHQARDPSGWKGR